MADEAGVTLTELGELLHAASEHTTVVGVEVIELDREAALKTLTADLEWEWDKVERAASYLTMRARAEFLSPPDRDWHDVVPSRFARRWSLNRRPFVARDDQLLWGRGQVLVALMVLLGQMMSGKIAPLIPGRLYPNAEQASAPVACGPLQTKVIVSGPIIAPPQS